jgi:alkyl hydroperoxide reductase subunit AhpC
MRTIFRFFAVAAAVALVASLPQVVAEDIRKIGIDIGDAAPMADIMMEGVDGQELSIAEASGEKGTLVMFSCNACPWVKAWEGRIAEIGNTYSEKGVGVIVINSNDPAQNSEDGYDVMKTRAEALDFHFPYVVDATSEVARAFGALRTPEAFLFDSNGKLVYHGTIDDNAKEPDKVTERYLQDALDAVVAGEDVPVQRTKALGCGIKFRSAS